MYSLHLSTISPNSLKTYSRRLFSGNYIEINNIKRNGIYFITIELNSGERFSRRVVK